MLLELAIGDAYGAGFEYARPSTARPNDLARYVQHPRHRSLAPGSYTDDTQMTLAIAEALASGEAFTREALARRFVEVFKRDPREGYAARFHAFLLEVTDGADFLARIDPRSDKSGAAMRAAPLGLLGSAGRAIELATVQARVTHDTTDGINAAVAAALAVHYFAQDVGPPEALGAYLDQHVAGSWAAPWVGEVGAKGWMSVRAAVTAVARNASLSALLRDCVDFGGDVDTVATVALAAASCSRDYAQDLPAHLVDGLENGPYGRDYLRALEATLRARLGAE